MLPHVGVCCVYCVCVCVSRLNFDWMKVCKKLDGRECLATKGASGSVRLRACVCVCVCVRVLFHACSVTFVEQQDSMCPFPLCLV